MRAKNTSRATIPGRRGRKRFIKPARVKSVALPKLTGSRAGVGIEPAPAEVQHSSYDGDTAFHLYLREIGQTPLLTPREEIDLARRIKKGDRRAREQMIKANLRLVVKIARDYESYGLPLLDLINEGNIGLMKGVERFDPFVGGIKRVVPEWSLGGIPPTQRLDCASVPVRPRLKNWSSNPDSGAKEARGKLSLGGNRPARLR